MSWSEIYGCITLAMLLAAIVSMDWRCGIVAAVLGCEYLLVNAAVGDGRFWAINPAGIGATLLGALVLMQLPPTKGLGFFVGCHGLTLTLHFCTALTGTTLLPSYEATINGIFGLQLLTTGGWGVWRIVRHRRSLGRDWAVVFRPRRAAMGMRQAFQEG
jgi:hypothetical protein